MPLLCLNTAFLVLSSPRSLVAGVLLYAVRLPDNDAATVPEPGGGPTVVVRGAEQLAFLPDSATVAALCTDGSVGKAGDGVPPSLPATNWQLP